MVGLFSDFIFVFYVVSYFKLYFVGFEEVALGMVEVVAVIVERVVEFKGCWILGEGRVRGTDVWGWIFKGKGIGEKEVKLVC